MERLAKLYLWQTAVTDQGASKLAEQLPGLRIDRGQDAEAMLRGDDPEPVAEGTAPINTECPVSGKPIDPNAFSIYEGQRVAFCCNNCKAKFDADPKPFLAKLGIQAANAPINATCPVSGKPIDPAATSEYQGNLVAFCCNDCKAKFDADPAKFADKIVGK